MAKLNHSIVYKGFYKTLKEQFDKETARCIWDDANRILDELERSNPAESKDNKMMVLPAAALLTALRKHTPQQALPLLKEYGKDFGLKIANLIHRITSIPGISRLLWRNIGKIMRKMSSPEAGYTREIVSETNELVGVDILSCPLHDAAVRIGVPETAQVICAMDKAYMTGFKHIVYTRSTSVAEGDACCDYRLRFDRSKK